ncbi:MAG: endonuclease III [candidate division Zixibacteria bacterium]|nr:endonuclease III [candidate division Zixibacteria bacterium]
MLKAKVNSKYIKTLFSLLEKEYGRKILKPSFDPLSELISTILSQNTSDYNSHRAFRNLKHSFKSWEILRSAPPGKIVRGIKIGGLEKVKAGRIKNILNQIYKERGKLTLSFLEKWDTERVKRYLSRFKGVGDKTIACVLLFSLGRPVFPVDTHILRVSRRIGLIPVKTDSKKAHLILQKVIPENLIYAFHLNLIEHGRKICKARAPLCSECVFKKNCKFKDKFKYI